jgi:hypothetical protein
MMTRGNDHANVSLTREILRRVAFQGMTCLDVGTQEAVVPILLKRGGAGRVVASDRLDLADRVDMLKRVYEADITYLGGTQLVDLPRALDAHGGRFFDLVVFSGVLYHLINPFGSLATVRGLCKLGGLMLVETAAIQSDAVTLTLNAGGRLYGPDNYFLPSTAWLDYALRMMSLCPLHVEYIGSAADGSVDRVAVLCRSVAEPRALRPDDWIAGARLKSDFQVESQVDWEGLRETVSNIRSAWDDVKEPGLSRSVYDTIRLQQPHAYTAESLRLTLASTM